ncbi:MAG: hypothetical protein LBK97_04300, partial [Prevotellaceae bacterium]|nr:hypothetical protein [Prevotellaceae bacterium]
MKLATGWERGADGKWRYEITYIELNDRGMEIYEEYYHKKAETSIKSVKLSEILDAKELFGAYPQFASKYVWLSKSEDGKESGEYDSSNESISVKVTPYRSRLGKKRTEFEMTLAHEIQHAIQHIEGFERGDNPTRKEGSKVDEMRKKWVEAKQAVYYMEDWDLYGGILDSFASDFAKAQISSVRHMRRAD